MFADLAANAGFFAFQNYSENGGQICRDRRVARFLNRSRGIGIEMGAGSEGFAGDA